MNQATAVNINVLANDRDSNSALRFNSVTIMTPPANGNATAHADGTIIYTSNPAFPGPLDSFSYSVSDDQVALSKVVIVSVSINLLPQASNMCDTIPQGSPITGMLPGSDPDGSANGLKFSLNADGLGGSGPILMAKARVEINNNLTGEFTYTPNTHPGRRGADTFEYRVEDNEGGSDSGVVSIIIDSRAMPVGDSLTQGIVDNFQPTLDTRIGYRKAVYDGLIANA